MKLVAAYYLLASCVFLLGYAAFVLVTQWADVEPGDIALVLIFWVLPCVAGIYVVLSNRLYRRGGGHANPK